MKELTKDDVLNVSGGFKFHFNVILTVFTAVGVTLLGGPVAGGMVIAGAIATQGTGNLVDMYIDEFGQVQSK
jgi:hypothetical protein